MFLPHRGDDGHPCVPSIAIVARKPKSPLAGPTGRRIVRVCSESRRTSQEIADSLGTTVGGIQHTLIALLRDGLLHTDAADTPDGAPKPTRGAHFWADPQQVAAAEEAAREAHDVGRLVEGELLVIVRGQDVASLSAALGPATTAVSSRWIVRLAGRDALWLLAMGPDRDVLLVDQLTAAVKGAGGDVEVLSIERLLDPAGLRAYLGAIEKVRSTAVGSS